jgi:hypothetical protein
MSTEYTPKQGDEIYIEQFGILHVPVQTKVMWVGNGCMIIKFSMSGEDMVRLDGERIFADNLDNFWRKCVVRSGDKVAALRKDLVFAEQKHKLLVDLWLEEHDKHPHPDDFGGSDSYE